MTKAEMIETMVNRYGHECKQTIFLLKLIEDYPNATDKQIENVFHALIDLIKVAEDAEELI